MASLFPWMRPRSLSTWVSSPVRQNVVDMEVEGNDYQENYQGGVEDEDFQLATRYLSPTKIAEEEDMLMSEAELDAQEKEEFARLLQLKQPDPSTFVVDTFSAAETFRSSASEFYEACGLVGPGSLISPQPTPFLPNVPQSLHLDVRDHEVKKLESTIGTCQQEEQVELAAAQRHAQRQITLRTVQDVTLDLVLDDTLADELRAIAGEAEEEVAAESAAIPAEAEAVSALLRPLTPEEAGEVQSAMVGGPPSEVLINKFKIKISRGHLHCLRPRVWLNDEVINFFLSMVHQHTTEHPPPGGPVHFHNTFFFTKLVGEGYNYRGVRRWTKRVDLFSCSKVIVPIHVSGTHWCAASIDIAARKFSYYDSMGGSGLSVLQSLRRYIADESMDKKKVPLAVDEWEMCDHLATVPQQHNGSDCGVFLCAFATHVALGLPLTFDQSHVKNLRQHMVRAIVRGTLA